MFEFDEHRVYRTLQQDMIMRQVISEVFDHGPYLFPDPTFRLYRDLLEAVICQQVSIRAAKKIFNRLRNLLGLAIDDPGALLGLETPELRAIGISGKKVSYLQNIAHLFARSDRMEEELMALSDDDLSKRLLQVRGIGVWTVKMVQMFSLGRPDIFPFEDLAIRQAIVECYALESSRDHRELVREMTGIAAQWKPWRSFACHLLWRWKRIKSGIDY